MGSIPTRSRHSVSALLLLLSLTTGLGPAEAQAPRASPPEAAGFQDTVLIPGVKPLQAFFMSLALPGWGQARLDRKLTAGLFIMFEGISIGMTMKTARELSYLESISADSARLVDKRRQRQDWYFLWGFNHLFAGLEAFVSSELHGFPRDVHLRAVPGGAAVVVTVPLRVRW